MLLHKLSLGQVPLIVWFCSIDFCFV